MNLLKRYTANKRNVKKSVIQEGVKKLGFFTPQTVEKVG